MEIPSLCTYHCCTIQVISRFGTSTSGDGVVGRGWAMLVVMVMVMV